MENKILATAYVNLVQDKEGNTNLNMVMIWIRLMLV